MRKKKHRLYNLLILQTDIWGKILSIKKDVKHTSNLKIIEQHVYLVKRKKTPIELPWLKRNKMPNT